MKQIPFIDLASQQARIRADLERRILAVLDKGGYIMGAEIGELEEKLCQFSGASHCVSCGSGSAGLLMALMAWGVGPGDAVFVPPFTFFATAEMPALLGATPVFADIDPATFLMRPDALESAIEEVIKKGELRPRAILPVDLFGQPADYDQILPAARKFGLPVLEDAAQSFGGTRHGRRVCALGCAAAVTSFFPAKPLGAYGDGGAIFTDDDGLAETLRSIRVHGKGRDKYDNVRLGINGRLDTMQAAVLLAKLEIFEDELEKRAAIAGMYARALGDIPDLRIPSLLPGSTSAWAQYCILLPPEKREHVAMHLKKNGIPTNIYYPRPLHMLKAFAGLASKPGDFPVASAVAERIMALPFHPYLAEDTVRHIAAHIREAMA